MKEEKNSQGAASESPRPAQACDLLASGQECYCEGTGIHTGVNPRHMPEPGDVWEFKLPGKRKRTKTVGSIGTREFIIERATKWPWEHKTAMLPYVHWARENKGRYTGITVRKLIEFGHRVATKAELDARLQAHIEKARAKRQRTSEQKGS